MKLVVWAVLLVWALLLIPFSTAKDISLDPCGTTNTYSIGNAGNAEWVMENNCIRLEMRKNTYDPNTEIYDKQNNRYFLLMANQLEERNNQADENTTTTFTSMKLTSDIDEGYIRWSNADTTIGYTIQGNSFKIVAEINNWNYQYADSDLYLNMRFHNNTGDTLTWIPVIVDGNEQPVITETKTAGINTFITQKIGRGNTIILDPYYYVDLDPTPAIHLEGGSSNIIPDGSFTSATDETADLTDGLHTTYVPIKGSTLTKVLHLRWNYTYENGTTAFLRFYDHDGGTTNYVAYNYYNDTHINVSQNETVVSTGIGWWYINITGLLLYQRDVLGQNYTQIRLAIKDVVTNDVAEVMMRVETNDTETPVITNCTTTANNFTCAESVNFTCTITDNLDVSYAAFTIDSIHYLASRIDDQFYFTMTQNYTGTHNYAWTDVTACDIFNQCDNTNPSENVLYACGECTENWQAQYTNITSCQTNNTILQTKTYTDTNSCGTYDDLPLDNGTNETNYCNYCDPDWQELTGGIHECQHNETRYVEYQDLNGCYAITNLTEDEPPYDQETWISCVFYDNDFNCSLATRPYLKEKIEYTCILPSGDWKCVNQISHGFDDILQVNPQKTERSNPLVSVKTDVESRESFETQNGILNAYFTNKNLVAATPFIITTICSDGNTTLYNQKPITPTLKGLDEVPTFAVWLKDNATYILFILLAFFIIISLGGLLWSQRKSR